MKNVLVTGADGFIGSHLTELLLDEGLNVRALAQYNSFNNWGWLEQARRPDLEIVCGDVRDADFCRHITRGIDTVFHLAALIAIPYSYVAPDSYVDTNIKGTLNMLQAAATPRVIFRPATVAAATRENCVSLISKGPTTACRQW